MTQDVPFDSTDPVPSGEAPHSGSTVDSLRQAMRRARHDNAERAGVLADLRTARIGRLELLREALEPLILQIPPEIDIFDIALVPGDNPRLFIDMIGFVEMGRDARLYRLLQDTRHERFELADSEDVGTMVEAVTDYVARRLLERDKAMAGDLAANLTVRAGLAGTAVKLPACFSAPPEAASAAISEQAQEGPRVAERLGRPGFLRWLAILFALLIDLLGAVAFFAILAFAGWYVWNRLNAPS